jgi:hypothetical protein
MTKRKKPEDKLTAGRHTLYKPEYCQEIIEYFDVPHIVSVADGDKEKFVAAKLPLFEEFAVKIGVCVATLHNWKEDHPEFLESYKRAQELQKAHWIECSLRGLYAQPFTIFMGKNVFGWRDKLEHEVSGDLTITWQD